MLDTTAALDLDWVQPSQDGGVILLRAIRRGAIGGFGSLEQRKLALNEKRGR